MKIIAIRTITMPSAMLPQIGASTKIQGHVMTPHSFKTMNATPNSPKKPMPDAVDLLLLSTGTSLTFVKVVGMQGFEP